MNPYLKFIAGGVSVAALVLGMGGCATLSQQSATNQNVKASIEQVKAKHAPTPIPAVTHYSVPYLIGQPITPPKVVPAVLRQDVVFNTARPASIYQLATQIGSMAGVSVKVRDIQAQFNSSSNKSSQPTSGSNSSVQTDPTKITARMHWQGSLQGLCDTVASRFGISWKYENGSVIFFKFETKTFPLAVSVMQNTPKNVISTSSSGSSSTVSSSLSVTSQADTLNPYNDVLNGVKAIVAMGGADAGVASVNPSLGVLTVTSTPSILRQVASYVRLQNAQAARNVMIGVQVYQVSTNSNIDFSASLSAALKNVANSVCSGVGACQLGSVFGSSTAPSNAGDMLSSIVGNAAVPSGLTGGGLNVNAQWSRTTTQAVLQALNSIGSTQLVTSGTVMTANGQPGPLQRANTINYIKSSTTTIDNGTATTSMQSAALTVGFTGNFLPRLLSGNRILLNYEMTLSSLTKMETQSSNGTIIQLPQTSHQSNSQSVVIKNGQTLMLAAFGTNNKQRGTGVGIASGYSMHQVSNSWLVILIHVVEVNP